MLSSHSKLEVFLGIHEENFVTKKYLIPSRPYETGSITWCVQRKKRVPVHFLIFYLCRSPEVYLIFTLHGIMIGIVAYYFQQFERQPKWDMARLSINGIRLYLGSPCSYKPMNNANRVLFIAVLLSGMIFGIILSTAMVKLGTTARYNPQIETIKDIIDNDFDLVGSQSTFKLLQQNAVISILDIIQRQKKNMKCSYEFRYILPKHCVISKFPII